MSKTKAIATKCLVDLKKYLKGDSIGIDMLAPITRYVGEMRRERAIDKQCIDRLTQRDEASNDKYLRETKEAETLRGALNRTKSQFAACQMRCEQYKEEFTALEKKTRGLARKLILDRYEPEEPGEPILLGVTTNTVDHSRRLKEAKDRFDKWNDGNRKVNQGQCITEHTPTVALMAAMGHLDTGLGTRTVDLIYDALMIIQALEARLRRDFCVTKEVMLISRADTTETRLEKDLFKLTMEKESNKHLG